MSPAEWLDLIEHRAPRLRAVGVLTFAIEGCSVQLATAIPEFAPPSSTTGAPESEDPRYDLPGYTFDPKSMT